jgi:glycosyltransferase involved in cell wall biosynthesis/MoaA/NifB/PqqE/SkfB family radical SAM enzyme
VKLSVVVPAFNACATLPALLHSLAAQTLRADEVIVVDDASTDATPQLQAVHPEVRWLRLPANGGPGRARNAGARIARGELLLFLDADTEAADPELVAEALALFAGHAEIAAASGVYFEHNGADRRPFARYLDAYERAILAPALDAPAPGTLNGCLCVIRREAFFAAGGFPEVRRNAIEDIVLGQRLTALGYRTWLSSRLRVRHRQPTLRGYLHDLVPRARHYVGRLARTRRFNETMGGAGEGGARLTFALALSTALAVAPVAPPLAVVALLAGLAAQSNWLPATLRAEGMGLLPSALGFHCLSTAAVCLGGLLGAVDVARHALWLLRVDAGVVLAYLRSLLTPGSGGHLIHFLTHRCNAHCRHCFDSPQRAAIGKQDELSLAQIEWLAATAGPLSHVSLTGGEPLLRDDLPQVFAIWVRHGIRSFSLATNGSRPEVLARVVPQMLAQAPSARLIVSVSVDALGSAHDRLRGVPGLYAQVERTLAVLADLRQWWPQLRVHARLTLHRDNLAGAPAVIARLAREGLDQIELNRLRGLPADSTLADVSDGDYDRMQAAVAAAMPSGGGLARLYAWLDRRMFESVRAPEAPWRGGPCLAGRRLEVVLADGTVLPCEMLRSVHPAEAAGMDGFVLGRLQESGGDLQAIRRGAQGRRVREFIAARECRCTFECAIFATLAYRPWRLLPGAA